MAASACSGVARQHDVNKPAMLPRRLLVEDRMHERQPQIGLDGRAQAPDLGQHMRPIGPLTDEVVKRLVSVDPQIRIALRSIETVDEQREFVSRILVEGCCSAPRAQSFKHGAHLEQLRKMGRTKHRHHGAAIRPDRQQPLGVQLADRLANRHSADAQFGSDILQANALSPRKTSTLNLFAQEHIRLLLRRSGRGLRFVFWTFIRNRPSPGGVGPVDLHPDQAAR